MTAPDLRIYMIHEEGLVGRKQRFQTTLQTIHATCGVVPKIMLINQPNAGLLRPLMDKLQQERTDYSEVGDPDFDKQREMLCVEHFSNLEKHKEAWKRIMASSLSDNEIHMVLEDDAILIEESIPNLKEIIQAGPALMREWDIVLLGLSDPTTAQNNGLEVGPLDPSKMKILPCKDSYLIRPSAARALLAYFNPMLKLRHGLRVQLSYKLFTDPKFLRVGFPNKRLFLDGSKLGVCCSSIHANNILILNKEYMDLFSYLSKHELSAEDIERIRAIYKSVEQLYSMDVLHIYGVLMYKAGCLTEAEEAVTKAISEGLRAGGVIHSRCDLLNNAINIYEKIQPDLDGLISLRSKYSQ